MAQDLYNNVKAVKVIAPISPSATGAVSGAVIDRAGFNSVTFFIANGAVSATGFVMTPTVKSGSATGSLSAVADADLIGTEAGAVISGGASDGQIAKIGYVGMDRYVTVDLNVAGTATGVHAVMAVLGDPIKAPQSTQKA